MFFLLEGIHDQATIAPTEVNSRTLSDRGDFGGGRGGRDGGREGDRERGDRRFNDGDW